MVQGALYLVTGAWPILDRRSFEAVTGPKTDFWLVRTVGVLIAIIGAVLVRAAVRGRPGEDARLLAVASALGLTAVDVNYVFRGRISRIYLFDAVAELGLAACWFAPRNLQPIPQAAAETPPA